MGLCFCKVTGPEAKSVVSYYSSIFSSVLWGSLSGRVTQTFIAKESECSGIFLLLLYAVVSLDLIIGYGNTKKYLRIF